MELSPPTAGADAPTDPPTPRRRGTRVPIWLAVGLIAAAAGGSGWAGWKLLNPPAPVTDLSQYESNDRGFGGARAARALNFLRAGRPGGPPATRQAAGPATGPALRPARTFVVTGPDGSGSLAINGVVAHFARQGAGWGLTTDGADTRVGLIPDRQAVRARATALASPAARQAAAVTAEQLAGLQAIVVPGLTALAPEVQARLLRLWDAYQKADAPARVNIDRVMTDRFRQAVNQNADRDAPAYHAAAEKIRAVLSADQVAKLRAGPRPATTTRAAVIPSPGMAGRG